jgi:hypothetical protein
MICITRVVRWRTAATKMIVGPTRIATGRLAPAGPSACVGVRHLHCRRADRRRTAPRTRGEAG